MLLSSWASSATTASKGVPDTQSQDDEKTPQEVPETMADTFPICQPEGARVLGGFGRRELATFQAVRETSMMGGEGQPLRLKLIRAILQAADDPDRDFLLQAEVGLQ